eukprot:g21426.t1
MYVVDGVPTCDGSVHVEDLTCLAAIAMTVLCAVVVNVVLKAGYFAANNGLFKLWQLFEGEKWSCGQDLGEVLMIIGNELEAVKNT